MNWIIDILLICLFGLFLAGCGCLVIGKKKQLKTDTSSSDTNFTRLRR